jgi:predicted dehydrogenase
MEVKMADKVGVAVVGYGFFAQNHLHAWQDLGRQSADLIAVCDIDAEKAKAAATKFNVPRCYIRLDDLLTAESPSLIDIVTRVETHKEMTLRTIAHGVPTIVQKPFARLFGVVHVMGWAKTRALAPPALGSVERVSAP